MAQSHSNSAYVVTWNPDQWRWDEGKYARDVIKTAQGKPIKGSWSTGNTKCITKGDRIFLFRLVRSRGIIASGHATSTCRRGRHWLDGRRYANYVDIQWDRIVREGDRLSAEELIKVAPQFPWNRPQASGLSIPAECVLDVESAWRNHVAELHESAAPSGSYFPDEIAGSETKYPEGAVRRVSVNAYERSARARERCVREHGAKCEPCGFDFEAAYGELGVGFIHVHHVRELASIGKEYEVDPVRDLVPVCPNCHAMLHRRSGPAMKIPALKAIIEEQRRRKQ